MQILHLLPETWTGKQHIGSLPPNDFTTNNKYCNSCSSIVGNKNVSQSLLAVG